MEADMKKRLGKMTTKQNEDAQSGMTLIEIMVVTLIMALISSGIAVAVMHHLDEARKLTAQSEVKTLRSAARLYLAQNPRKCPTVEILLEEGIIEDDTRTVDPWETPYIFHCSDSKVVAASAGPDKIEGTEDDLR
jgi:prepilin-type N-terminal cleavage/methylation domain-containing protein